MVDINLEDLEHYSVTKSIRNQDILHHGGYSYSQQGPGNMKHNETDTFVEIIHIPWICRVNQGRGCKGRIVCNKLTHKQTNKTIYNQFRVATLHAEFCSPSEDISLHDLAKQRIYYDVSIGRDFNEAYNEAITTGPDSMTFMHPDAAATFPSKYLLERTARRISAERYPPHPKSHQTIQFTEPWKHRLGDIDQPLFLLKEKKFIIDGQNHSILIFGVIDEGFRILCGSKVAFADGDFDSCPFPYNQLFTLNSIYMNRLINGVYCLLTGKSEAIYKILFKCIAKIARKNNIEMKIKQFMVDFEKAISNAILDQWPFMIVKHCYFHYCQCLYARMASLKLKVSLLTKIYENFILFYVLFYLG